MAITTWVSCPAPSWTWYPSEVPLLLLSTLGIQSLSFLSPVPSISPCKQTDHKLSPFQRVSWTSSASQAPFCSHSLPSSTCPLSLLKMPRPYLIPSGSPPLPVLLQSVFLWQQVVSHQLLPPAPRCAQAHLPPLPNSRFYAMCFYLVMQAMVEGFGGKEAVLRTLKDTPVMIHTGPCCCCCPCCPRIKITRWGGRERLPGEQTGLFCTLSRASAGSLSPASSLMEFGLYRTKPVMKGWASHSQDPHTGHPHRGRRNRGRRTPEFHHLHSLSPTNSITENKLHFGLFTFPFHPFQLMRLGSILR